MRRVISLRHRSRRCPAGGHRIEVDAGSVDGRWNATVCLRRFIAAFTMVIGLAAIAQLVHATPPENIRGYCSVHQSHRYRLICEQEEQEAKARLYRQVDLPYGIPRDIWYYCGTVYSSWRHMEICARDELRGKGLLEPR